MCQTILYLGSPYHKPFDFDEKIKNIQLLFFVFYEEEQHKNLNSFELSILNNLKQEWDDDKLTQFLNIDNLYKIKIYHIYLNNRLLHQTENNKYYQYINEYTKFIKFISLRVRKQFKSDRNKSKNQC